MLSAEDARDVCRVARDDPAAVWCRVVEARGLGGIAPGESAVVARGQVIGTVLRGVLDADLVRLVDRPTGTAGTYSIGLTVTDATAAAAGLIHGGRLELFVQKVAPVPPLLWDAIAAGRPVTVVTVLSGSSAGVTAVIDDTAVVGDERLGELGAGAVIEHHAGLVGAMARRRTVEVNGERLLIEVLLPVVTLGIVGTGELADALCAQAELLGWGAFVVGDGDPDLALDAVGRLGPTDALVVLSHQPAVDTPALAGALAGGIGFVGALGSRRTQAARAQRLAAAGMSQELIADIHGPLGLDLGAASPAETAMAITAEILLARSGRSGLALRTTTGRITT
ncbi:MAG TPA: XdhC family protein [Acidimicrobiales bacterium]|jgi:xanthine dehydrogenase accessory factor